MNWFKELSAAYSNGKENGKIVAKEKLVKAVVARELSNLVSTANHYESCGIGYNMNSARRKLIDKQEEEIAKCKQALSQIPQPKTKLQKAVHYFGYINNNNFSPIDYWLSGYY